jgi:purine-binding chemotaxis protein CheW
MVSLAQTEEKKNENRAQYVIFQIGPEEYGVDINQVQEIIKPTRITNVPNTETHVLGVINLRGQIVPVVDLKRRFNFNTDNDMQNQRIITVEVRDTLIGLLVDNVNEVIWLNKGKLEPAPEIAGGLKQEYLEGIGKVEERLLVLIQLKKLLFDEKKENNIMNEGI